MFKVIVLDDEPSALQHICSIIKLKCPDFEVVATAEDGVEGIEKIKKFQPDVVISDVKMPLMNGIELLNKIKEDNLDVCAIIVSGYQDFEYAKGALKCGVTDYILKPVMPSDLKKLLDEMSNKLKEKHYQRRNKLIRLLCNGIDCEDAAIVRYFPYKCYYGAIIRRNGLPRRFFKDNDSEIFSNINEIMTIYGRDEMEALYIIPEELLFGKTFATYLQKVTDSILVDNSYITTVYSKQSFPVAELQHQVKNLYRMLDTVSVVGLSQTLSLDEISNKAENEISHPAVNEEIKKIEYLLNEKQYDKLKKVLKQLYLKWFKEKRNQLEMENISRQILYIIRKHNPDDIPIIEYEYMMEDAFFYATSCEELIENLFDIIFKYVKETADFTGKVDSQEFFMMIKKYLEENMHENISLQSVCKIFAVSQTHLSRLFRKYEQQSFNRYLTAMRMEKAKHLMEENPEMYIKDVASRVGYNDQFYFSRIFHSYMGKSPTDYLEEVFANKK